MFDGLNTHTQQLAISLCQTGLTSILWIQGYQQGYCPDMLMSHRLLLVIREVSGKFFK